MPQKVNTLKMIEIQVAAMARRRRKKKAKTRRDNLAGQKMRFSSAIVEQTLQSSRRKNADSEKDVISATI
jgi:hypothetical protein